MIDIFGIINGSPSPNALIPARDVNAVSGSQFIQDNMNNSIVEREANILKELLAGNIPDFLRNFKPVTVTEGNDSITYLVMSDVLSIGDDSDYLRIPCNALTSQAACDKY